MFTEEPEVGDRQGLGAAVQATTCRPPEGHLQPFLVLLRRPRAMTCCQDPW